MNVRSPETPDEFRDALLVIRRAWQAAFEGIVEEETLSALDFGTDDDERMTERFENATDASDRSVLVVIEDNEIVATGSLVWSDAMKPFADASAVELRTLYVDPAHWGEGIGTTLLGALLSESQFDADRLVLETLTGNDIGISFYRSQGFEPVGEHEFTVGGETYPTTVFERSL